MRLTNRLKKLESSCPPCDGRVTRVVVGEYAPTDADRCRRCGGCHLLVINKVIVTATQDADDGEPQRVATTIGDRN